ncbi:hypothetical protein SUNI508_00535 [Seiridium unicorne]|uniref:Uncharacterized protein n=1 Tax=Seiridium unicorne TaxID=138068 RepID=A0ABR2V6Y7_9PEZI
MTGGATQYSGMAVPSMFRSRAAGSSKDKDSDGEAAENCRTGNEQTKNHTLTVAKSRRITKSIQTPGAAAEDEHAITAGRDSAWLQARTSSITGNYRAGTSSPHGRGSGTRRGVRSRNRGLIASIGQGREVYARLITPTNAHPPLGLPGRGVTILAAGQHLVTSPFDPSPPSKEQGSPPRMGSAQDNSLCVSDAVRPKACLAFSSIIGVAPRPQAFGPETVPSFTRYKLA